MPFLENLVNWLFSILHFQFVSYAQKPVVMATQMSGLLGSVSIPIDMVFQTHNRESDSPLAVEPREKYQKQIAQTTQLPKRITKKGLFRGAGILNLFYAWNIYKDKLPLTVALLGEACEYSVGYRLRKIEWAKDCCIKRGIVPSRNQLNQLASIRKGNLARVFSDAMDKAIEDYKKVVLVFPPINDDGPTLL